MKGELHLRYRSSLINGELTDNFPHLSDYDGKLIKIGHPELCSTRQGSEASHRSLAGSRHDELATQVPEGGLDLDTSMETLPENETV